MPQRLVGGGRVAGAARSWSTSFVVTAAAIAALVPSVPASATPPTFVDATEASGLQATHSPSGALIFAPSVIADLIAPVVVGDFNRDGFQDVFVVCSGAAPDKLFMNNGDGTFTDRAAQLGVAVKHMGLSACVGDYDDDGDLDIYVTSCGLDGSLLSKGKHRLYRNDGETGFTEVAAAAGVQTGSPIMADGLGCAFGDVDLDGDLDLVITGYFIPSQGNRLFRNNGNGTFTDATAAAGLAPMPIYGMSPRLCDMDGDRYPELLIAADFHTSRYFANDGDGTFTNLTASSGTGTDDNGMGQTVADFDGDQRLDWFVTSIYGTPTPESPGTGNRHYRNIGPHLYQDVAAASGTLNGSWGWGVSAADLDHGGAVDLVQTAGWFTVGQYLNKPTRVWMNDGAGHFTDIAASCGLWCTLPGRGLLTFDADNDGDREVLIFASKGPLRFFRNDLLAPGRRGPPDARWLTIAVDAVGAPDVAPDGIGTLVKVTTGSLTQRRVIDGGTNYGSQDELAAHFGLGAAAAADEVRLQWANGTVTLLRDVRADQRLTVVVGRRCDLTDDGKVDGADLGTVLGAWGPIDAADPRDLDASGAVDAADLVLLFKAWGL